MFAYATLVTNEDYAIGATALARSLQRVGSAWPLLVLSPPGTPSLDVLEAEGCIVRETGQPALSDAFRRRHTRQAQHARSPFTKGIKPTFHDPLDNFVKLRLWELVEYERIVFIDADAIAVRNIDRLFGYPALSAAPNLYESLADMQRMNSGVFVAQPDRGAYEDMVERLDAPGRTGGARTRPSSKPVSRTGTDCPTSTTFCSTCTSTCRRCGTGHG